MLLALLPLLALWTHTPPAPPVPQVTVNELKPRLLLPEVFRTRCGEKAIDACTRFIGYKLQARCVSYDGLWNMTGTAEFTPMILMVNTTRYRHELQHVADVKGLAERYLLDLENRSFTTRSSCEEEAALEKSQFKQRMQDFAAESNRLLR